MAALRAPAPSEQESVGALVQRVSADVTRIVRAELALVRLRAEATLRVFKAAGGGLAAAAVLLLIGAGTIMAGTVLLLATVLPAWLAAFAIGGGLFVLAAVLAAVELRVLSQGVNEALAPVDEEVEIRHGG